MIGDLKICLEQNIELYNNDLRSMIQAFFGNAKIVAEKEDTMMIFSAEFTEHSVRMHITEKNCVTVSGKASCDTYQKKTGRIPVKRLAYQILNEYTGRKLPWGNLTGVRPTKIAMAHLEDDWTDNRIIDDYLHIYDTAEQKAKLALSVAKKERELLLGTEFENEYCLYVGIPFCPSTCLYCSFPSYSAANAGELVERYFAALHREIKEASELYRKKRLTAIYIGGGTPTAVEERYLNRLLELIYHVFDMSYVREITVEAGRPDSINKSKLHVLKEYNVSRISINPQTMHDSTLAFIGRAHTAEDTRQAFHLARSCGFDNINMDMIVGLPEENITHAAATLKEIEKLSPDSLTVHSLTVKRAANLNIQGELYRDTVIGSTNEMLDLVEERAESMEMFPYYLYRQKNSPGNLENVGYARRGKECLYNVLIMEEKQDILAVGAGASTKRVRPDKTGVDRIENVKNVEQYVERIDEMIERKRGMTER